jgi:putative addiction module CopG family antidote
MNVTLPKDLEEFVRRKTASGEYPDASAVVADALRVFQGDSTDAESDVECSPQIKELLLQAINGPHHPMKPEYFDELRRQLRAPVRR